MTKKIILSALMIVAYVAVGLGGYMFGESVLHMEVRDALILGSGLFVAVIIITEGLSHKFHWNLHGSISAEEFLNKTKLTNQRQIVREYKKRGGKDDILAVINKREQEK